MVRNWFPAAGHERTSLNVIGSSDERKGPERHLFDVTKQPVSVTESIEIFTNSAKRITAWLDRPVGLPPPLGVVLVAPAYGETKENNIAISYYFAANGFYSVRFDWSEHIGESDGDIHNCTLSNMMNDLVALMTSQKSTYPHVKVGLAASSLAGRVGLKLSVQGDQIDFLVLLAPVVNLQDTLRVTYQEDLVGNYKSGKRYGTLDVLGFSINADVFLEDAIENGFCDLRSSLIDAQYLDIPTVICAGERDTWVQLQDVAAVYEAITAKRKTFCSIPVALHRFTENPAAIGSALKHAVQFSIASFKRNVKCDEIGEPVSDEVHARETYEKALLKGKYEYSREEERNFWRRYLSRFKYICNIHDYWNLLEQVYENLGGAWSGQKILDAGCGNGNYGLFLVLKQAYKTRQKPQLLGTPPCFYYGLDFVSDAVSEAKLKVKEVQHDLAKEMGLFSGRNLFLSSEFILGDLEAELPFRADSFDQICCNLVVSYLEMPEKAVAQLCSVLKPGGKLVISSLKPNPDLSEVYRNFLAVAENDDGIAEARKLLSNAGAIRLKEARGLYHFYSEVELKRLVRRCGLRQVRVLRSFGNQANVVIGRKA